jgi:hypothetical protein
MRIGHIAKWPVLTLLLATVVAPPAARAQSSQTATQFYQEYVAAFAKATKIEDVMKYMAAENRKQIEATPADERAKMFGMIKLLGHTDIKVLKEERAPDGKTVLSVEGVDSDKAKGTGKITLVKEGGAWKIGEESWSTKS